MALSLQLARYLRRHGVGYFEIRHEEAFTSAQVAGATQLRHGGLAKVVALRDPDDGWILAIVPAGLYVDVMMVQLASGHRRLVVASEIDIVRHFGSPGLGGSAAFDELSGVPVYLDDSFGGAPHIYLPDGSNSGIFGLRFRDYLRLARPIVGAFGTAASYRTTGHA